MASIRAVAIRKQNAIERLMMIAGDMALRAGIEPPVVGKRNQDPELARVQDLEAVADFLEKYVSGSPQSITEVQTDGNEETSGEGDGEKARRRRRRNQ
jgi:hypothetical protein